MPIPALPARPGPLATYRDESPSASASASACLSRLRFFSLSLPLPLIAGAHCVCSSRCRCSRSSSASCRCSRWPGTASRTSRSRGALLSPAPSSRTPPLHTRAVLISILSPSPHSPARPSQALSETWSPESTLADSLPPLALYRAQRNATQYYIHLCNTTARALCLLLNVQLTSTSPFALYNVPYCTFGSTCILLTSTFSVFHIVNQFLIQVYHFRSIMLHYFTLLINPFNRESCSY